MNILRKLLICIAALVILLDFSPAQARVIYSGILNIEVPNFNIDINNDGQIDFETEWNMMKSTTSL
jgi:hypothetical protein